MDLSLDEYIGKTNPNQSLNFQVQIRNDSSRGALRGGKQRGGSAGAQRGGFRKFRGGIKSRTMQNRLGTPITVSVNNNAGTKLSTRKKPIDARERLGVKARPMDAREKLGAKARLTDARNKIAAMKAKKLGKTTNDARMIISRKTEVTGQSLQVTMGDNGNQSLGKGVNTSVSSTGNVGNFQITRKLHAEQVQGSHIKMTDEGVMVTVGGGVLSKTVSNVEMQDDSGYIDSSLHNTPLNPVIQVTNDQYQPLEMYHPIQTEDFHDDEDIDDDYGMPFKPTTFLVEKTLTVKKPQLLSKQQPVIATTSSRQTVQRIQMEGIDDYQLKRKATSSPITGPLKFAKPSTQTVTGIAGPLKIVKSSQTGVSGPLKLAKPSTQTGPLRLAKPQVQVERPSSATKLIKTSTYTGESGPLKFTKSTIQSDDKRMKTVKTPDVSEIDHVDEEEDSAIEQKSTNPQLFRVIISNLHSIVVEADIVELFGAIGPMQRARMLKSGVAEVVYKNKEDVQKAIQKYHNRELDGMPMQVKLYMPPKTKKSPAEAILGNVKDVQGPLKLGKDCPQKSSDLDVDVLHKVLFKKGTSSKTNPVAFTVKV